VVVQEITVRVVAQEIIVQVVDSTKEKLKKLHQLNVIFKKKSKTR
jgi:hypothetical protein